MSNLFRVILALVLLCSIEARAQFDGAAQDQVKASLVADTTAVVAGKPFTVLIRFEMKAGWHIYWQFGGDSGAPPTVTWELPAGFTAGPIQWPLPTAHMDEGDLLTYIYEGEALLPVEITPAATIAAPEVSLKAKLSWLVCEKLCIPGRGEAALTLPVGKESAPANEELIAKARAQLPKSDPPPFKTTWQVAPEQFTVKVSGLAPEARVEFFPLPPNSTAKPKRAQVSDPGSGGDRTITVPVEGGAADTAWQGLLVAQIGEGPRTGWMIGSAGTKSTDRPPNGGQPSSSPPPSPPRSDKSGALGFLNNLTLGRALWAAALGGLILNLMPCVLPVIALKIFSFVNQAGEHPERVFRLGLSFVAGVFVFFLAIAALAIGLRAAGHGFFWGMQFADPRLMLALIGLVVVFALAMFGVFEITLGGAENTLGTLAGKEGYGGAFVHGLFTTLLGTSCTAPFIGPVLGFAVTQPSPQIVFIFLAMAAGMSAPYFLLTWQPAWMRFLPKPGVWMERFKQLMGFVLLAVAVWLLGVFGNTRGPGAAAAANWLMLFLALGAWILGVAGRRWWAAVLAVCVIAAGAWLFLGDATAKAAKAGEAAVPNSVGIVWEPFSPNLVDEGRKAGRPVFIDFTAAWCANCITNERFVLNTAAVATAFKQKNVLTVRADWSDFDPVISEWLKRFDRIGVPLYVLYRPGEDRPVIFPELLTQNVVLDALATAGAAN
jgi:thiol:disulfide interchange protein DsbD